LPHSACVRHCELQQRRASRLAGDVHRYTGLVTASELAGGHQRPRSGPATAPTRHPPTATRGGCGPAFAPAAAHGRELCDDNRINVAHVGRPDPVSAGGTTNSSVISPYFRVLCTTYTQRARVLLHGTRRRTNCAKESSEARAHASKIRALSRREGNVMGSLKPKFDVQVRR
jgi:hypothetical protein